MTEIVHIIMNVLTLAVGVLLIAWVMRDYERRCEPIVDHKKPIGCVHCGGNLFGLGCTEVDEFRLRCPLCGHILMLGDIVNI